MEYRSNKNPISQSNQGRIEGYAATFWNGNPDTQYRFAPDKVERIKPGAIQLRERVVATFQHDLSKLLGVTPNTLSLSVDGIGLRYSIQPTETATYKDVVSMMRSGMIDGSSFGFEPLHISWSREDNDTVLWLDKVDVKEVSIVVNPAYEASKAWMRSVEESYKKFVSSRFEKIKKIAYIMQEENGSNDHK